MKVDTTDDIYNKENKPENCKGAVLSSCLC